MVGTSLPVINVPGATGGTGMAKLLSSPADGYSMAVYIADSHALLAERTRAGNPKTSSPSPSCCRGHPSFSYRRTARSRPPFEKAAKEKPGTLKVATLGFGSVDDFTLKYLEGQGIKVIQVPFSKPSERYVSILGGHADALYEQAGDVAQFLNGKQMRPLILFGKERHPAFKDIPASFELGYKWRCRSSDRS